MSLLPHRLRRFRSHEATGSRTAVPGPVLDPRRLGASNRGARTPSVDSIHVPPEVGRVGFARDLVRSRALPRTRFALGREPRPVDGVVGALPRAISPWLRLASRLASPQARKMRLFDVCNLPWARAPTRRSAPERTRVAAVRDRMPRHEVGARDARLPCGGPAPSPSAVDAAPEASAFALHRSSLEPKLVRARGLTLMRPNGRGVFDRVPGWGPASGASSPTGTAPLDVRAMREPGGEDRFPRAHVNERGFFGPKHLPPTDAPA